jgi:hypothetical protein
MNQAMPGDTPQGKQPPPRLPYVIGLMTALFVFGVSVGYFQERAFWWIPFFQATQPHQDAASATGKAGDSGNARQALISDPPLTAEGELLQLAFTGPLIDHEKVLPAIESVEGIYNANESTYVPEAWLADAYGRLAILESSRLLLDEGKTPVLKVRYRLRGRVYEAHAYGQAADPCKGRGTASLIIPGSGTNQSSAIFEGASDNYHHGILEALREDGGDVFVLVKPNEDILAFHDGAKKLDFAFIINYYLNRGGSYSASYIVQSLAVAKYLKACYRSLILAGLSQGGAAVLLASLQAKPRAAIVASGYSTLVKKIAWSGFEQIVLPSGIYWGIHDAATLRAQIAALPTQYLFSWGKNDSAYYKLEVENEFTCKAFARLRNVHCTVHDGGHVFPVEDIKAFLRTAGAGS